MLISIVYMGLNDYGADIAVKLPSKLKAQGIKQVWPAGVENSGWTVQGRDAELETQDPKYVSGSRKGWHLEGIELKKSGLLAMEVSILVADVQD